MSDNTDVERIRNRPTASVLECLNERKREQEGDSWYLREDRVWYPGGLLGILKEGIREDEERVYPGKEILTLKHVVPFIACNV